MTNTAWSSLPSLVHVLRLRAEESEAKRAMTFLVDGEEQEAWLTYGALDRRARAVGAWLQARGARGERVLLLLQPGLDCLCAFLGCLYAGAVAVPAYPLRKGEVDQRLRAVVADANPAYILCGDAMRKGASGLLAGLPGLAIEDRYLAVEALDLGLADQWALPDLQADELAFLQYTSGSTGLPKGVMVSHRNLMHNEAAIQRGFGHLRPTVVSWLPMYHDMGLIGTMLHPLCLGGHVVSMAPTSFVQSPIRWLRAIARYRAQTSGAPNFGYELCIEKVSERQRDALDLSAWTVAFTGSEPVRAQTMRRFGEAFGRCGFNPAALFPCYGLAEATLFVSGGPKSSGWRARVVASNRLMEGEVVFSAGAGSHQDIVSNGPAWDSRVLIVDPAAGRACPPGHVGEIWIQGPSVARGYWGNPEATEQTFGARLAGSGEGPFLRTGDLGFMHEGELFVTGRLKDLIILRGRNLYPQDVEFSVEASHPALRSGCCAAFSVDRDGEEGLVVVQEVERGHRASLVADEVFTAIRRAVVQQHQVAPVAMVLIDTLSMLKTSSGKVQRRATRQAFLSGALRVLAAWPTAEVPVQPHADLDTGGEAIESKKQEEVDGERAACGAPADGRDGMTSAPASVLTPEEPAAPGPEPVAPLPGWDNALHPATRSADVNTLLQWLRDYGASRLNSRLMDERRTIPPYVVLDLGNRGLLGMQIPRHFGGLGWGWREMLQVVRQCAAIDGALASFLGISNALALPPLLHHASAAVRERVLPLLASGRELAAFAITEPGAGSNPMALQSRAVAVGPGHWRLEGEKVWIGLASWAGVMTVFVREQDAQGGAMGISGFVVRQGAAGLRHGPEALTMGMRGMVQNSVYLEGVAANESLRVGAAGAGMQVAQEAMMATRLTIAAGCVGTLQRAAQLMLRYAGRRQVATGQLLHHPLTRQKLTSAVAAADALDALVMHMAAALDDGAQVPLDAYAACKILGPELAWRAVDDLAQVLGGRGYIESNGVPQMLRDVRIARVFEGPTETLQMYLGARLASQPQALVDFMSESLGAPALAAWMLDAAQRILRRFEPTGRRAADVDGRQWAHAQCGTVAAYALLAAAAQHAHEAGGQSRHAFAAKWAEAQAQRVLREATAAGAQEFLLPGAELESLVGGFAASIGDVEQTLAGEAHGLDPWLRKEPALPHAPTQDAMTSGEGSDAEPVYSPSNARTALASQVDSTASMAAAATRSAAASDSAIASLQTWMVDWISKSMHMPKSRIDIHQPFADFGLDSIKAIEFAQDLESWLNDGVEVEESLSWRFPTVAALAEHLAADRGARKAGGTQPLPGRAEPHLP